MEIDLASWIPRNRRLVIKTLHAFLDPPVEHFIHAPSGRRKIASNGSNAPALCIESNDCESALCRIGELVVAWIPSADRSRFLGHWPRPVEWYVGWVAGHRPQSRMWQSPSDGRRDTRPCDRRSAAGVEEAAYGGR